MTVHTHTLTHTHTHTHTHTGLNNWSRFNTTHNKILGGSVKTTI